MAPVRGTRDEDDEPGTRPAERPAGSVRREQPLPGAPAVEEDERLTALDDLSIGVYFFDADLRVRWLNKEALRRLGKTELAPLVGRDWFEIHPEMRERRATYERVLAGESLELQNACAKVPEGDRYYDVRYQPLRDRRGLVGFSIDVTDRYHAEERLKVANRLESLGRLASGFAHDLNNHLTAVFGYVELSLHALGRDHPQASHLERVIEVSRGSQALIEKLLDFARQRSLKPKVHALSPMIDSIAKRLLQPLLSEDLQVKVDLDPGAGSVLVDGSAIEQVFVNLVVNARDALPKGGVIQVRTFPRAISAAEASSRYPELQAGEYLVLEVTDNGPGMDAVTRARCFEPFFTTKDGGKNSGLGLSTCFGTVRQMGGLIELQTELGRGTTFLVLLPRAEAQEAKGRDREPGEDTTGLRGTETVLLVEDQEHVRGAVASMLLRYGYHVLEASNGGEALLIAEEIAVPIHVMLTDVVMPRVSGPVLAKRMEKLRPEMRVIYMSGHTMHPSVESEAHADGIPLLGKPFSGEEVARLLRRVLDEPLSIEHEPSEMVSEKLPHRSLIRHD